VSIDEEFLLSRQREAIRNPREQGRFKTKHLNCWVSSRSAYFNMQKWIDCRGAPSLEDLAGEDCILSLDLASKVDIAELEIIFPRPDGGVIRHGFSYLPESTVTDPKNAHYAAWQISGDLTVTDGDITDYSRIRDDIMDLCARFNVLEVAYDPFQATMLVTELQNAGVPVIEYRPTVLTMSEPMKHLDALIISGKLQHDCGPSHPMTWMMSNVVAQADAKDNVYPRKEKPELKIDGPVALIAGLGRLLATEAGSRGTAYQSRGLLVL
jgi:phage terminase large subunit-like protein